MMLILIILLILLGVSYENNVNWAYSWSRFNIQEDYVLLIVYLSISFALFYTMYKINESEVRKAEGEK